MNPLANAGRSIGDLLDYFRGITRYETPTYTVRGVNFQPKDLRELGATAFNEISNNPATQADEARVVANTLINRVPQYQAQGGKYANFGASQALAAPNQYQGFGKPEYQRYIQGNTVPTDQGKLNAINTVLDEIKNGTLKDNTGGRVFYMNSPTGKIFLKDGTLFKQPAQAGRSISDLTK